jgi:lipopolysaccharide assembly outer membrane protein LptD (OstA)
MKQNYDFNEIPKEDKVPGSSQVSDLQTEVGIAPTSYLGFTATSLYDVETKDANFWDFGSFFRDDRGDVFALRYQYTGPQYDKSTMMDGPTSLNQIEGNIELVLTEQARFGYYARFDEIESEIQSNRLALRFSDSCKCWFFDLGYGSQLNPDREFVTVSFTLAGLGALNQKFGLGSANAGTP